MFVSTVRNTATRKHTISKQFLHSGAYQLYFQTLTSTLKFSIPSHHTYSDYIQTLEIKRKMIAKTETFVLLCICAFLPFSLPEKLHLRRFTTPSTSVLAKYLPNELRKCQKVLRVPLSNYTNWPESDAVQIIVFHLFRAGNPVEHYTDEGYNFNRRNFASKYNEVRLVFLVIPLLLQSKYGITFKEVRDPSDLEAFRLHVHRDVILYLIDKSVRRKAVKYRPHKFLDDLPTMCANILVVEYGGRGRKTAAGVTRMLWVRVPCTKSPVCMWILRPSLNLSYNLDRLSKWRRNLGGLGVELYTENEADYEKLDGVRPPFRALEGHIWRHRHHPSSSLLPWIHIAQKANFTLYTTVLEEMDSEEPSGGKITLDTDVPGIWLQVDAIVCIFLTGWKADMLIYGSDTSGQDPFYLSSVLTPFAWYIWFILLTAIVINVALILIKSKKKDLGDAVLSVMGPLLNQAPSSIPPGLYFWTFLWVVLMIYMNNAYLGVLESLQIVPKVSTVNDTFEDLLQRDFKFYASENMSYLYKDIYLDVHVDTEGEDVFSTRQAMNEDDEGLKKYVKLAAALQATPVERSTKDFWKLESAVWLESNKNIAALEKALTASFQRNYNVLKQQFTSMPTWILVEIPHSEVILSAYKVLTDAGIVNLWDKVAAIEAESSYRGKLVKGLLDSGENDSEFMPVQLEESLVLEALFINAIGVGIAFLCVLSQILAPLLRKIVMKYNRRKFPCGVCRKQV